MRKIIIILATVLAPLVSCGGEFAEINARLKRIRIPPGFAISAYAQGVENARQLALGDRGAGPCR